MSAVSVSPLPRLFLILSALALASAHAGLAAQEATSAKGLVIYRDSPQGRDEVAAAMEFTEVEAFARVTNVTPVANPSEKRRLPNNVVAEVVDYVDLARATIATEEQINELRARPPALGALASKYPRALNLLAAEGRRIQVALQQLDAGKVLIAGQWQDKAEMTQAAAASEAASLTVTTASGEARTYTGVRVAGKEPDTLRIMHSGGAATIPIEQLSEEDREKYGLDLAAAEEFRKQKAMAEASAPEGTAIGAMPPGGAGGSQAQGQFSLEIENFLSRIEPGISIHEEGSQTRQMISDFIGSRHVTSFYAEDLLEKGKPYIIDSLAGQSVTIFQRVAQALVVADVHRQPCAVLLFAPEKSLDGTRLGPGSDVWGIGRYLGDQDLTMTRGGSRSLPFFQLDALVVPTGSSIMMVRFEGFQEPEGSQTTGSPSRGWVYEGDGLKDTGKIDGDFQEVTVQIRVALPEVPVEEGDSIELGFALIQVGMMKSSVNEEGKRKFPWKAGVTQPQMIEDGMVQTAWMGGVAHAKTESGTTRINFDDKTIEDFWFTTDESGKVAFHTTRYSDGKEQSVELEPSNEALSDGMAEIARMMAEIESNRGQ